MKLQRTFLTLALGLGLFIIMLWLLGDSLLTIQAQGPDTYSTYYVASDGDCNGMSPCFSSIQAAVDAVDDPDDVIKVASGTYTDMQTQSSLNTSTFTATQMVAITKSLTLRGGYDTADWTVSDLSANPTTLDVQGLGRAIVITGPITVTIESLRITGGDGSGLGGVAWGDNGGGLYVYTATVTISGCTIFSNTASTVQGGDGGGVYLENSNATLSHNAFYYNTGSTGGGGGGGAVYSLYSNVTLDGNTIQENVGSTVEGALGGGLVLGPGNHVLRNNFILSNTATLTSTWSYGGGIDIGGGGHSTLENNWIQGNIASKGPGWGGGLYLCFRTASLWDNTFIGNIASTNGDGEGGGAYLDWGGHTGEQWTDLRANVFISNTATLSSAANGWGGGLGIYAGNPVTLTNNLIVGNHATQEGSGLRIGSSPYSTPSLVIMNHNTIADNVGCGIGIHVDISSTLIATNILISGHSHEAITVAAGSAISMQATLWHGNGSLTGGDGSILTGTVNVYGDPAFFDPTVWNYHLGSGSAAIDAGVAAGVTTDIDGHPRPMLSGYDIGADEALGSIYLPLVQKQSP
jgi:fibronectin-binding autotransporter adhesin